MSEPGVTRVHHRTLEKLSSPSPCQLAIPTEVIPRLKPNGVPQKEIVLFDNTGLGAVAAALIVGATL